jgi:integrase
VGWARENPVKGIKLLKENARRRYLEVKEIFALLDACTKDKRRLYLGGIVKVALFAGLRKIEVLSLKRKDIDFERNILLVADGKGGYQRYVPMSETVRTELMKLMDRQKGDFIFHDS